MPTDYPNAGDDKKISLNNSKYSQFDYDFSSRLKENYPTLWGKYSTGGQGEDRTSFTGSDAFNAWGRYKKGDRTESVLNWIKRREKYFDRFKNSDNSIAIAVGFSKWGGFTNKFSQSQIKKVINQEKLKIDDKKQINMKEFKTVLPFEIKKTEEDELYYKIEGYASTFGNIDLGDDIVISGAFKNTLKNTPHVPVLWQHDLKEPVGRSTEMYEDIKGLFIKARLPKNDSFVRDRVIPQMQIGNIQEMSIGFRIKESDYDADKGVRLIKEVELFEFSLVTKAMNPQAVVTSFKSFNEIKTIKDIEILFREKGFSRNESKTVISKIKEFADQRDAEELKKQREAVLMNEINNELKGLTQKLTKLNNI